MAGQRRTRIDIGAVVFYRPDGATYYLDLNRKGRRRKISLGTSDKDQAIDRARVIIRQLDSWNWGTVTETEIQLVTFARCWLEELSDLNRAQATIDLYQHVADSFIRWTRKKLSLKEVTPDMLQKYFSRRAKHNCPATSNRDRRILRAMFNAAVDKRYVRCNPVDSTKPQLIIRRVKRVPSEEQIRRFLDETLRPIPLMGRNGKGNGKTRPRGRNIHDVSIVILNCGLRLGEVLGLRWTDISFEDWTIQLTSREDYRLKDREERIVPMNEVVFELLEKRHETNCGKCELVFTSKSGRKLDTRTFAHNFKVLAVRAGLPWLCPQALRRAFATINSRILSSFQLKAIMGHSSIRTTESYYIDSHAASSWKPAKVGGA